MTASMRAAGVISLYLHAAANQPFENTLLCFINGFELTASDKPNVVFILSDNQSYYEMSCHGHADIKTPHIDKLAGKSVEFTNFHAPPFCSPSRAVILTGRYAMRSGVFTTIAGRSILHKDLFRFGDG